MKQTRSYVVLFCQCYKLFYENLQFTLSKAKLWCIYAEKLYLCTVYMQHSKKIQLVALT